MPSHSAEVTNARRKFHELGTTGRETLAFGPFLLDPETGRLREGERVIPLAPKPFETLLYLAQRPRKVVAKAELIDAMWPDTFVTEDVLVQSIVEIRRALGDPAKSPRYVQTLPRRGYQFLEPVSVIAEGASERTLDASDTARDALPAPAVDRARGARWPKTQRLVVGVGAALLAVALVLLALGRRRDPPEPSVVLTRGSLLVMPIEIEEPEPQSAWLRQGLAEMLRAQLGQTPGLHVVARHRLSSAFADADATDGRAHPSDARAAALARALGAERLVTGSFVRVQGQFVINTQVVDVADNRTTGTAAVRGRYPEGLLEAVDDLCVKLVPLLEDRNHPATGAFRPMRLATRSLDASRHYVEALGWFARGGRRGAEEAERRLAEALRLDSRFAQAYLKLAEVQQWGRRWGYGQPDPGPAVQAAEKLSTDLPDRERLLVKSYVALLVRHDPAEAVSLWRSLLNLYPTYAEEAGIPSLTAETLQQLGRWDDLILLGQAHVEAPSLPDAERARLSSLLARGYRRKGELEPAARHARRAVALWPSQNGPEFLWHRAQLGRILLESGRGEEALQEFRASAEASEAEALNLNDAAWGFYMAGDRKAAERLVARAIELDRRYGNAYHLRGWLELADGQAREAARSFETAWELTPRGFGAPHQGLVQGDLAALYYAGVAWTQAGQHEQAKAAFERLLGECREREREPGASAATSPYWQAASFRARALARLGRRFDEPERLMGDDATYYVQSARLHAVAGRRELALKALTQGLSLGHGELRHVRDDPDFESLRSEPEFLQLIDRTVLADARTPAP